MTVLTFPSSPIIGQLYNAPNQIQYVYDGVKWTVETVASSSAAVTNSVQDRVAPMFVNGPNTGISFTYNAGTNVMSAAVTAVNGNQLVNGVHEFTLESNGALTLPNTGSIIDTAGSAGTTGIFISRTFQTPDNTNASNFGTNTIKLLLSNTEAAEIVSYLTASIGVRVWFTVGDSYPITSCVQVSTGIWTITATGMGNRFATFTITNPLIFIYTGSTPNAYQNFPEYVPVGDGASITVSKGVHDWTFGVDGATTLPHGQLDYNSGYSRFKDATNTGVQLGSPDDQNYVNVDNTVVTIQTNSDALAGKTQYNWAFGTDGSLTIPGDLINPDGFILNAGGHGSLAIGKFIETPGVDEHFHIAFPNSNVEVPYQDLYLGNDFNYVKIRGSHNGQTLGVDIGVEGNRWAFTPGGTLQYPQNAVQQPTDTVTCAGNTSTVVYTASGQYQHTIKLLIQVEGSVGAETDWDTQACEMMVTKSLRADDVASTVYGIVHTSTAPLATFTAQWNALTNRVQVLCATPSANGVYVRTFATEIYTAD